MSGNGAGAPFGQVVLEGVLDVAPEVFPVDEDHPAPPMPRPWPRPGRTPLTWSVMCAVSELFIVSA